MVYSCLDPTLSLLASFSPKLPKEMRETLLWRAVRFCFVFKTCYPTPLNVRVKSSRRGTRMNHQTNLSAFLPITRILLRSDTVILHVYEQLQGDPAAYRHRKDLQIAHDSFWDLSLPSQTKCHLRSVEDRNIEGSLQLVTAVVRCSIFNMKLWTEQECWADVIVVFKTWEVIEKACELLYLTFFH